MLMVHIQAQPLASLELKKLLETKRNVFNQTSVRPAGQGDGRLHRLDLDGRDPPDMLASRVPGVSVSGSNSLSLETQVLHPDDEKRSVKVKESV